MPTVTYNRLKTTKEIFHERDSDLYGRVILYAPNTKPSKWHERPWKLVTERGPDGALKYDIKPAYVMQAFERPHFIEMNKEWIYPTVEL